MLSSLMMSVLTSLCLASWVAHAEPSLPREFWASDDTAFQEALSKKKMSVAQWVQDINAKSLDFLCLGETHENEYRQAIAKEILTPLRLDRLFLEATAAEATDLVTRVQSGEQDVSLLNADITAVLQAALARVPATSILGVEQTPQQAQEATLYEFKNQRDFLTRDGYIAWNIDQALAPKSKSVALYGALHCAANDLGLGHKRSFYRHLQESRPHLQMQNALVMTSQKKNAFVFFLKMKGLDKESFVIPDTRRIPSYLYNDRWDLKEFFENYQTLIYFADEPTVSPANEDELH